MVTDYQFVKSVRSLAYRRRLNQEIPELESIIHQYLLENKLTEIHIPGYFVHKNNGHIILKKCLEPDLNQLELELNSRQ